MPRIRNEKLFLRFSRLPSESTDTGRRQFFENQSYGTVPKTPDSYYLCLVDGKEVFDLQCSELHQMYKQGEWWGWYQLWSDWEGERWVIPYLCRWHRNIPKWVSQEC